MSLSTEFLGFASFPHVECSIPYICCCKIILIFLCSLQSGEKKKDDETVDSLGKALLSRNMRRYNETFNNTSSCKSFWFYGLSIDV